MDNYDTAARIAAQWEEVEALVAQRFRIPRSEAAIVLDTYEQRQVSPEKAWEEIKQLPAEVVFGMIRRQQNERRPK